MKRLRGELTKWQWCLLILAFVVGGFLRLYALGNIPNGLYWDEAAILVDARAISETGRDMHGRPWFQVIFPSYGDYKQPVYIWLASLAVTLVGPAEWVVRLPSALVGILTIVITAGIALHLGKVLWPTNHQRVGWWAVAAAWIVSISPWSILFSRTAFEANLGQLLLAASVWCMVLALRNKWWLSLAVGCGALATYSYFSVRFVWPMVLLSFGGWWIARNFTDLKLVISKAGMVLLAVMVFGLLLVPMIKSPLYPESNRFRLSTASVLSMEDEVLTSNVYREMAGNQSLDRIVFHRYWLLTRNLLANYADHLDLRFLFLTGDANLRHGTGAHGLFVLPLLLPFCWGWLRLIQRHPLTAVWLLVWWLAALLPASVPETTPHALRSLNALVPLTLVMSLGIVWIYQDLRVVSHLGSKAAMMFLLCLAALCTVEFWLFYTTMYPRRANEAWQGQYRELAQEVVKNPNQEVQIIPFDDRFYLWLMLYGKAKPTEWQSWKSEQFIFKTLPKTTFSPQSTTVQAKIIAGEPAAVADFVAKNASQLESEVKILDGLNNHRFSVVTLKKTVE